MAERRVQKFNKIEARAEALSRLRSIMDSSAQIMQEGLHVHLCSFLKEQKGIWGSFWPMTGEASPLSSISDNTHIRWAFPRISGDALQFYSEPKVWVKGKFGIEEPDPEHSTSIDVLSFTGCLVPGLAFDRSGMRLGRGWGYFDRTLEHFKGLKVGVTFEDLVFTDPLPSEAFDIPMDVLITERGITVFNTKGDR